MTSTMLAGIPHVRSGRLRALAVTGARRSVAVPELPTVAEAGVPGYEAVQWYGILAPAGTPREIIARLHGSVARALQDPAIRERFLGDGADLIGSTPEEFAALIKTEIVKWAKVIREAGIKPEG